MASFVTTSGETLTIGSGGVDRTTWGDRIRVVDPGKPLSFGFWGRDPQKVWEEQPSVRKVVSFAARAIAAVPWHAFDRVGDTDRQRQAGGRVEETLNKPSPTVSGYMLLRDLVVDLMMYDRCCAVLTTDGEIVRVPPRLLEVGSDFLGRVNKLHLSTPTQPVDLLTLPVFYTAGWNAMEAYGTSSLTTLRSLLDEQARAVQWRADQWDRGAKMSTWVEHPGRFKDPKAREEWLAGYDEFRHSKAGGTPIFENGMKLHTIDSLNPVDAKDLEGRQLTDVEVCSFFHIPPELVGAREGTFANIAAYRHMLYGPTLGPTMTQFDVGFNTQIIPALAENSGEYAELDRDTALNGSFLEQAAVLQTAVGGPWMTRAEARGRVNLPHLDGTDELITPKNVTEGGQASPRDTAPPGSDPAAEPDAPAPSDDDQ